MYQSQHFISLSLYLVGLLITLIASVIGGLGHVVDASIPSFRGLGHFVGFIGLTCMAYVYAQACQDKAVFRTLVIVHAVPFSTALVVLLGNIETSFMPSFLAASIVELSVYFIVCAVFAYKVTSINTHQHFMWIAMVLMLCLSFGWELIEQPLFHVYGEPARGYIQWEQVLLDILAISLTSLVLYRLGHSRGWFTSTISR